MGSLNEEQMGTSNARMPFYGTKDEWKKGSDDEWKKDTNDEWRKDSKGAMQELAVKMWTGNETEGTLHGRREG